MALLAMVSYQAADRESSVRLRDELSMRGLAVVHDRTTFGWGNHVATEMENGVARCDAFVACVTPHYLYEGAPTGAPRPALDSEFIPVVQRRRDAAAEAANSGADPTAARPLIYPVVRHLGDPRTEAPERVRAATGVDISGWWTPRVDQVEADLPVADAAKVAGKVLSGLLRPGAGSGADHEYEIVLVTRGGGQPPGILSIDATALLGGSVRRVGDRDDWRRYMQALVDVEAILAAHGQCRTIRLRAASHVSAGILFGRIFNQAAGWRILVSGRHGVGDSSGAFASNDGLEIGWEPGSVRSDWISVEIDLIGHPVFSMATDRIRTASSPPRGRLQVRRSGGGDLQPDAIARMARAAAEQLRTRVGDNRPRRATVMCASPIEFAVLLGNTLTALWCDLELLERSDAGYETAVIVPSGVN